MISGPARLDLKVDEAIPASRLFTRAADPDGFIAIVRFWDSTPGAGYLTLDGIRITGAYVDAAPSQLDRVAYFAGPSAGANDIVVEAIDGNGKSSNNLRVTIRVQADGNQAPVTVGPRRAGPSGGRTTLEVRPSGYGASEAREPTSERRVAAAGPFTELLFEVEVNQQKTGETAIFLRDAQGGIHANEADLRRWRIRLPASGAVVRKGVTYYPLRAIRGTSYKVDVARQSIAIDIPPEGLGATVIDDSKGLRRMPPRPGLGGFFNYSLFGERISGATTTSAELEAGAFGSFGLFTTGYLARRSDLPSSPSVRLETTWTYDDPEKIATARVGDSINRSGPWGRSLRFGGVQYGTNFATQPTLVTSPGQTVLGQASVPSTVDVFVNNALVSRSRVPPGPFSITNIPVVTGTGDVQVVVRDAFGREQIITQPFYATPTLLKAGLSDYAIEGGFKRDNYSLASNDYGSWLASGTYRYGFSDQLTGTLRGEADRDVVNVGASADYLLGNFATLSGTIAGGPNDAGNGALLGVGVSRQARKLSFNVRSEYTTPDFRQLGLAAGQLPPERLTTVSASYNFGPVGSVGAALVGQYYRDQPDVQVGSLSYSVTIPGVGFVSLALVRTLAITQQTQLNATLTVPIGRDYSATLASNQSRPDQGDWVAENSASFQKNLPAGDGYGYLLRATNHGQRSASLALQNGFGTYSAEIASQNGTTGERVNIAGGIGVVGDRPFLSRLIRDGFALVRVGFPDVRVYLDGQPIGRTDAHGDLILPRMLAYQSNVITLEQLDLPLDVEIGTLKLEAIPYFRSGTVVEFPIRRIRSALIRIVLDDGKPLPAGATVRVVGQEQTFPVGLEGIAYVAGLAAANQIVVEWRGTSCALEFALPETADLQARIGPLVCKGVKR